MASPTNVLVAPPETAVSTSSIHHRRLHPSEHAFSYRALHVWTDPDTPHKLCRHHRLWSDTRLAPVQVKRRDYFDHTNNQIGPGLRNLLTEPLGYAPTGQVRMLSQPRTLGWLFNPITIYLVWGSQSKNNKEPAGAVLEVTNTPWHERHRYATKLVPLKKDTQNQTSGKTMVGARVKKELHVSPFLDNNHHYDLAISSNDTNRLTVRIDVVQDNTTVLETSLTANLQPASKQSLGAALRSNAFTTMKTSAGIYTQAARLKLARVPFVPHPKRAKNHP